MKYRPFKFYTPERVKMIKEALAAEAVRIGTTTALKGRKS